MRFDLHSRLRPQNYPHAFYFAKSAGYDVADLHRLAHDAQAKTQTTLSCKKVSVSKPLQPLRVARWLLATVGGIGGYVWFAKARARDAGKDF